MTDWEGRPVEPDASADPSEPLGLSPADRRVELRLEQWKRQLIDLTLRNRLLNYRATKVSTIEVAGGDPAKVFADLMEGRSYRFEPEPEEEGDTSDGALTLELGGETGPSEDSAWRDMSPEERTDYRLQTAYPETQLEKNLSAVDRRAQTSLREQGVNSLFLVLGMLRWYESPAADTPRRAPLILVPVSLTRATALAPYTMERIGDEPLLNPALAEKMRLDFDLILEELPQETDTLDLRAYLESIGDKVSAQSRWSVTDGIVLGLFSFQKFLMYKDLERNAQWFRTNNVIRSMCRAERADGTMPEVLGQLPSGVINADLDEAMGPWAVPQVVDADSSQQRAILAVRSGQDLVVEGPPGTGKSQTITNLIANAVHQGKKVLFVAEKMAALEVVKTRLEAVDMAEFVLELHGRTVRKTEFVKELAGALNVSEAPTGDGNVELGELKSLTRDLKDYVVELHTPREALGISVFEAIGRFAAVYEAPEVSGADYRWVTETGQEDLHGVSRTVQDLGIVVNALGPPLEHSLRGIGLTWGDANVQAQVKGAVDTAVAAMHSLVDRLDELTDRLPLAAPKTLGEAANVVGAAATLADYPGVDPALLSSAQWKAGRPALAETLVVQLREYTEARGRALQVYQDSILDMGGEALKDAVYTLERTVARGFWRWFRPSHWKVRRLLRFHRRPNVPCPDAVLLEHGQSAVQARNRATELRGQHDAAREVFGRHWQGTDTEADSLERLIAWLGRFHEYAKVGTVDIVGAVAWVRSHPSLPEVAEEVEAARGALRRVPAAIVDLTEVAELDPGVSQISSAPEVRPGVVVNRLVEIGVALHQLPQYARFNSLRSDLQQTVAAGFVDQAVTGGLPGGRYHDAFLRGFYDAWTSTVISGIPVLRNFFGETHEDRLRAYRAADTNSVTLARREVRSATIAHQSALGEAELQDQRRFVEVQSRKRRNIAPVRTILSSAPDVVQLIKPCFMMSPLTVAQYLDPEALHFDLLVYDEASQIPPADAVGAVVRADQLVVVGDSRQLPPTNFFDAQLADDDLEELLDVGGGLESILDELAVSGTPKLRLTWHYRSLHESLIRFSNEEFYGDEPLLTFPHADPQRPDLGLQFVFLKDAYYEGRGQNLVEARVVAEAVAEHARSQPNPGIPGFESLGVGTFGIKQADLILDELNRIRREDPSIEWFFQQNGEQPFFVKNLENIQGDDRDVIFLSVTYGPDQDGNLIRNFGPINTDGGGRRLNVLTTRAKKRLKVFSSMRGADIDPQGVSPNVDKLRRYLTYAETGEYPTARLTGGGPESPFEGQVLAGLMDRGYDAVPQVGEGGYRIDLGVVDPDQPGRFLCGVECDGATYHSARTVRDRDRLRHDILESRGWTIHRVWSTDWFQDPEGQMERLVQLIETTRAQRDATLSEPTSAAPEPPPETERTPTQEAFEEDEPPVDRKPVDAIPVDVYVETVLGRLGDREEYFGASIRALLRPVNRVVETEGPVHPDLVTRRIAAAYGVDPGNPQAAGRVRQTLDRLEEMGRLGRDGAFYVSSDAEASISPRRRAHAHGWAPDLISGLEVRGAVRLLLTHRAPLPLEAVAVETIQLLGLDRSMGELKALVEQAVDALKRTGVVREHAAGLALDTVDPRERA